MKEVRRACSYLMVGAFALSLGACGGDSVTPPPPPTPPPTPAAAVTATGNGAIVIHPSIDPTWFYGLEMPIRVQETAGGTADWNYARLSLIKDGVEVERAEIGSDILSAGGAGRVTPRSNNEWVLGFRVNSDDWNDARLELGLADVNHGNAVTAEVPFETFSGVTISLTPLFVPEEGQAAPARP